MTWTVCYHIHQSRLWDGRALSAEHTDHPGPQAYANQKSAVCKQFARQCQQAFQDSNPGFVGVA